MDAAFSANDEPEVLYRIGNVDIVGIDVGFLHCRMQKFTGRTHKWMTVSIFAVSRLFPHEHEARASFAFTKNGLRSVFIQIAAATRFGSFSESPRLYLGGR